MSYPKKTSRDTILDSAMRFVETHGREALSMRTLAALLGVTPNALYRYFASKAELEFAISDEAGKLLLAAMKRAAANKPTPQAIKDVAKAYLRFAHQHPQWYAIKMQHCDQDGSEPDSHKRIWDFVNELAASLPLPWPAEELALSLWAFLHGMVELSQADLLNGRKPEATLDVGLNIMLLGLMQAIATHSTQDATAKRELGH
jgi:AcrR family transcriptional regulator